MRRRAAVALGQADLQAKLSLAEAQIGSARREDAEALAQLRREQVEAAVPERLKQLSLDSDPFVDASAGARGNTTNPETPAAMDRLNRSYQELQKKNGTTDPMKAPSLADDFLKPTREEFEKATAKQYREIAEKVLKITGGAEEIRSPLEFTNRVASTVDKILEGAETVARIKEAPDININSSEQDRRNWADTLLDGLKKPLEWIPGLGPTKYLEQGIDAVKKGAVAPLARQGATGSVNGNEARQIRQALEEDDKMFQPGAAQPARPTGGRD